MKSMQEEFGETRNNADRLNRRDRSRNSRPWLKYFMPERVSREIVAKIGAAVFGWVAANVHLGLFDKIYQIRGRLARLLKIEKSTRT